MNEFIIRFYEKKEIVIVFFNICINKFIKCEILELFFVCFRELEIWKIRNE